MVLFSGRLLWRPVSKGLWASVVALCQDDLKLICDVTEELVLQCDARVPSKRG